MAKSNPSNRTGNRGGTRTTRSKNNNPEGHNQFNGGLLGMARERPAAAAAAAAGAVAAGVFLWSKRAQISDQLNQLSDQIGEWKDNLNSDREIETVGAEAEFSGASSEFADNRNSGGKASPTRTSRKTSGGGRTASPRRGASSSLNAGNSGTPTA